MQLTRGERMPRARLALFYSIGLSHGEHIQACIAIFETLLKASTNHQYKIKGMYF